MPDPKTFRRVVGLLVWEWQFVSGKSLTELAKKIGCKPTWLRMAVNRGVSNYTPKNKAWLHALARELKVDGTDNLWNLETAKIVRKHSSQM